MTTLGKRLRMCYLASLSYQGWTSLQIPPFVMDYMDLVKEISNLLGCNSLLQSWSRIVKSMV